MNGNRLQQIYESYSSEIYVYLYSLCRNRSLAEDLTQETFVKALLSLPEGHGNVRAWLYTVARNLFFNHYRREPASVELDELSEIADEAIGPEEALLKKLSSRRLYEAVLRLDARKREVILLQYFSGFPQAEIASMLGITQQNVRVLSHRAKKELKKYLEENENEVL